MNTQTPLIASKRCDEETVYYRYIRKTHLPPAAASQMIKDTSGNHDLFIDVVFNKLSMIRVNLVVSF